MTTVDDFDEYMDADGYVTKGGPVVADVLCDVKFLRDTIEIPVLGASNIYRPGKVKLASCKITRVRPRTTASLDGSAMTATPSTGAAETLKTARSLAADGWVDNTDTAIAAASRIRLTVATSAITTAGYIVIVGEDSDGNHIEEAVSVGLLGVGEYATSARAFLKAYGTYNHGVASTGVGTLTIASITGSSTYTIDDPEIFDLVIGVSKGTKSVVYTLPDCWIPDFGLNFSALDKEVREEHEVKMRKPSAVSMVETIT